MRSYRKTFGANRLVAAFFLIVCTALAASIFVPGATDYIANANLGGRLRMFNAWEPGHRLLLAYGVVGLMAAAAVFYLRLLIDNTMVVLDSDGIEVRHPFWTHRGLWRDFDTIATSKFFGASDIRIRFLPGRDAQGRKLSRKVRLPSPLLGIKNKAVLIEVMLLTMARPGTAPTTNAPVRTPGPPPATGARRPVFGKRQ